MIESSKFINIYDCANIYNIYDENILNILESIKINFRTEIDYDIFINNKKYLHEKNNNYILLLSDICSKFGFTNIHNYIYYVKTNCNFGLTLCTQIDEIDDISDYIYKLFNEYTNIITNTYFSIKFSKKIKIKSVYLHLFFYKNNRYDFPVDSISYSNKYLNNICICRIYNSKHNGVYYTDFTKYILINSPTKFIDKYMDIDNMKIRIHLYNNNKSIINLFDIICCINILETYDNKILLILTPIKIIDNSTQTIINIYNKSCTKCKIKYNSNNLLNKFYSNSILRCIKHDREFENKISYIFQNTDNTDNTDNIDYLINQNNIKNILYKECNILFDIKTIYMYS